MRQEILRTIELEGGEKVTCDPADPGGLTKYGISKRFNPDIDRRTGYRTRSVLCMPLKDKDGRTIGVFQLLNKPDADFDRAMQQSREIVPKKAEDYQAAQKPKPEQGERPPADAGQALQADQQATHGFFEELVAGDTETENHSEHDRNSVAD